MIISDENQHTISISPLKQLLNDFSGLVWFGDEKFLVTWCLVTLIAILYILLLH